MTATPSPLSWRPEIELIREHTAALPVQQWDPATLPEPDDVGRMAADYLAAETVVAEMTIASGRSPRLISAAELMGLKLPEPRWVVPGLLVEGLALLAGKPKQGKSWLTLDVGVAVSCGGRALGHIPVEIGDVLYLALEDGLRRLQDRLRPLLAGAPAPKCLEFEISWPRLDQGGLELLEEWLTEHPNARLVVIDTLARVRPVGKNRSSSAYAEDYAALAGLQQLALRFHVAILVVHHLRKQEAQDPLDLVSGTTGLTGAADTVLVLARERGRADAVLHVVGRDVQDAELALQQNRDAGGWVLLGDAAEYRLSQERQVVIDVIRGEGRPMGPKEVAETLGKSDPKGYQALRQLLSRMAKQGELHASGGGAYDLLPVTPVTPITPLPGVRNT